MGEVKIVGRRYSTLIVSLFLVATRTATASTNADCGSLTAPGKFTERYAENLKDKLSKIDNVRGRIAFLLKSVHESEPINSQKPSMEVLTAISEKFGAHEIASDKTFSKFLAPFGKPVQRNAEVYRQLHNLYGVNGISSVFFGPTAENVFRLKMAFGCSHYARALKALIAATGVLDPADVRYVAAVSTADEDALCKSKDPQFMANGHQFLSVKIDGKWFYLNASSMKPEFIPQTQETGETIQFPSLSKWPDHGRVAVAAVDKPSQPLCDGSLNDLKEIYRSVCVSTAGK